jgi:DNA repair exonuclease SbcCD ATPase subunit
MKIVTEISLENFEAWSGAINTLDRIRNAGKCDALEAELEMQYPDGMTDTELNDLLWFDSDWCYEACGMRSESAIREELEEAKERLEGLEQEFEEEAEELREEYDNAEDVENAVDDLWRGIYADEADELRERITELEEELDNL